MNPRQKFLERALAVGLDCGMITPADVIKHCSPDVLAHNLPPALKAKLLEACLSAPKMDAELIVKVLGTVNLAETMPMAVLWQCIAEAAARALGNTSAPEAKPATVDDKNKPAPVKQSAVADKPSVPDKPAASAKSNGPAKPPPGKNGPAAVAKAAAAKKPDKTRSLANGTNKTRVPKNEFDVDTDVGEDVAEDVGWDDDIVEVVEEDVIGASTSVLDDIASNGGVSDWSRDEETVTRDVNKR